VLIDLFTGRVFHPIDLHISGLDGVSTDAWQAAGKALKVDLQSKIPMDDVACSSSLGGSHLHMYKPPEQRLRQWEDRCEIQGPTILTLAAPSLQLQSGQR
jgi:hypothetical protein